MFSNVALDVFIGLIFIFLLYSLLATAIKEFVATTFSYRGRMLERGIEQMLDGKNYSYYWWDKVFNFFIWLYYRVSTPGKKRISDMGSSATDATGNPARKEESTTKLPGLRAFTTEKTEATRNFPKRITLNKKAGLFAAKVTDHPLYKRAAENKFFFKKPAYLSADSFSDILIDLISGKQGNASSGTVLMKDIRAFINNEFTDNQELKRILNIYIDQANGDLQRFKGLIENWYDETMNRVSGWYKKQATRILIIIGFLLAIYGNVDAIKIARQLSNDKTAREQLVNMAIKSKESYAGMVERMRKDSLVTKDSLVKGQNGKPDTVIKTRETIMQQEGDEVFKKTIEKLNGDISSAGNLLGLGWYDRDSCVKCMVLEKKADSLQNALYWLEKKKRENTIEVEQLKKNLKDARKQCADCYEQNRLSWNIFTVLGWLITAIAISMGAPFWFDLLNKFVNLRISGAKPEEASKAKDKSRTATLNQHPSPNPKAFG